MADMELYLGDCVQVMKERIADESVQCCVTSPPYYGLRDYGVAGQIGLEETPEQYVERLVEVFREVRRVLKDDGTLWINLGDSYNGSGGAGGDYGKGGLKDGQPKYPGRKIDRLKPKDLIGIPWMVAFALRADGWYLRSDIIWSKPNPMPESVTDRPTKAHEYIFLLSKSAKYYYDADAISETNTWPDHNRFGNKNAKARLVNRLTGNMRPDAPQETDRTGRNKRSVWTVAEPLFTLRKDLTPEQRRYVLKRIADADSLWSCDSHGSNT